MSGSLGKLARPEWGSNKPARGSPRATLVDASYISFQIVNRLSCGLYNKHQ